MSDQTGQCSTLFILHLAPAPDLSAAETKVWLTLSEQQRFILDGIPLQSNKIHVRISQQIHANAINIHQCCSQDNDYFL